MSAILLMVSPLPLWGQRFRLGRSVVGAVQARVATDPGASRRRHPWKGTVARYRSAQAPAQTTGPRARWSPVRDIFKKTPGQCFPPGGPVVCGWPQGDATRASWAATRLLGVGPGRTDELLDIGFVSGDSAGRGVGRGHTRHGVRQTPFREMSLQTRSGSVAARGARRRPLGNETADCHSKHRVDRSPQRTLIKKITRFTKNIKFRNKHK